MTHRGILVLIGVALLVALGAIGVFYHAIFAYSETPYPPDPKRVIVEIPEGLDFRQICLLLEEHGLVSDADRFYLLGRIRKTTRELKAGEYEVQTPIRPDRLMNMLVGGEVRIHKFTIPEGYNLRQIAQVLAGTRIAGADGFLQSAFSPEVTRSLGIEADTLEGYLFPDTYRYTRGTDLDRILRVMISRFNEMFDDAMRARAAEVGMTVHEAVTFASIIEKETGRPSERDSISAVFHNRLRRGMKLESDPTVIYGIKDFDGNLTRRHLSTPSPYNTYVIKGLPPGPICSPGLESLKAALNPSRERYLFFVSKNDGSHYFSETYAEHLKAVNRYQRKRRGGG